MTADSEPRPGTALDLSRRMDRIESRQDGIEAEVRNLAAVVARVEGNQNHAAQLNDLRFTSLDTAVKAVSVDLTGFMKRIEALITGEQTLPQQADWTEWRKNSDRRLDAIEDAAQRRSGGFAVFGGIKAAVIIGAAVASPIVTLIALFMQQHPPH